jgi:two-component system chemotaxis response regulator CheB
MKRLVVVGVSLGGLKALQTLLAGLPVRFAAAVAIVQHRSADSSGRFVSLLRHFCALPVQEPQDKERIFPARVYVAPADYHLLIEDGHFALTTDAPILHARPSINALFESAAESYQEGVIGVVLTGASTDGTQGAKRIKEKGGLIIVQTPETAECAVMPQSVVRAGLADHILALEEIAPLLVRLMAEAEGVSCAQSVGKA